MVYIGGTAAGRFIPTLLNETADPSERRIVITQNALADGTYLDYFAFQYSEQIAVPTHEQSQAAFKAFVEEAQKRFEHDRDFPDEPKQVRNGETLALKEGRFSVGGAQAVMDINEGILKAFMKSNPDLTFAMEESFPFKSLYPNANPLGPIFEVGDKAPATLSPQDANAALQYWQSTASELTSDPISVNSKEALKPYSHMAKAQAAFFNERGLTEQAERAYQIARQIYPGNIEAATGLADLYSKLGRPAESAKILDDFARAFPDQRKQIDGWRLHGSLLPPNNAPFIEARK
jgi:tetratricopeptide (TPR) repeat protein